MIVLWLKMMLLLLASCVIVTLLGIAMGEIMSRYLDWSVMRQAERRRQLRN